MYLYRKKSCIEKNKKIKKNKRESPFYWNKNIYLNIRPTHALFLKGKVAYFPSWHGKQLKDANLVDHG